MATLRSGRLRIISEILIVILGRVGNLLGAVISLKLLTVYLSVEEFGRFGIALAASNAIAMLCYSAYGSGTFRFTHPLVSAKDSAALNLIYNTNLTKLTAIVLALGLVSLLAALALAPPGQIVLAVLCILTGILLGLQLVTFNGLQAMRKRALASMLQAMTGLSRGLIAVPFILLIAPNAEWSFAGVTVFLLVLVAIQWFMVEHHILGPARSQSQQNAAPTTAVCNSQAGFFAFCRPLFAVFAFGMVSTYADRFLTAQLLSLTEVAVLVAFMQIARSVSILSVGVAIQFIYPIVFEGTNGTEQFGAKKRRHSRQIWLAWAAVLTLITVLAGAVSLVAGPLVRLLTTADYAEYANLLPLLVFAVAVPHAAGILIAQGMHNYATSRYILPKAIEAVVVVAILLISLPLIGIYGVPLAYAVSGLVLTIGYFLVNISQ